MSHDSDLKKSVLDELKWEPSVNSAHIGVTAKSGVIILTGHVDSYAQKHAAEEAVPRVKGVTALADKLEVSLPSDITHGDEDIAAAANARLLWNVSVPRNAIKVKVERGWVTLIGKVDWHFEKLAAEIEIRSVAGVIGVSDKIEIKPRVNVSNLGDDTIHALHRSVFFDPKVVSVTAQEARVKLTGQVQTFHDRNVAAMTAWSAPGTTSVENNIAVV